MIKAIGFRQIVFSINCLGASLLALFIAFSLNLQTPSWAMTTVYLTSQPLSGVLRAKAVYRVIGTVIGGIAMVAIVPNLIDAPELTTVAIILWVALCLYISLFDRTPRSYAFMLSGYTAALIGFPSVLAPATVFDTAISRRCSAHRFFDFDEMHFRQIFFQKRCPNPLSSAVRRAIVDYDDLEVAKVLRSDTCESSL